ncbi:MAG: hypothetical protein ABIH66_01715 [bacterium]
MGTIIKMFPGYMAVLCIVTVMASCGFSDTLFADDALDQKAELYVYSIFAPGKLSEEDRQRLAGRGADGGFYDPTLQLFWVAQNWKNLSEETKEKIRPFYNLDASAEGGIKRILPRTAQLTDEQKYNTSHFQIVYSTTDPYNAVSAQDGNSNGTPDYIETVGAKLEEVYNYEINTRGFPAPPYYSEETHYFIYVLDLLDCGYTFEVEMECEEGTLLGLTGSLSDYPSSFIMLLDHDYYGNLDYLDITAAHEFFHAIQFGRSGGPPTEGNLWFFEGQAVWMQSEMYPDANIYLDYLNATGATNCDDWFYCTGYSITSDVSVYRPYGSVIFFKYFTEYRQNTDAVRQMQDLAVTTKDGVEALRQYVISLGTTLPDLFLDFGKSLIECSGYSDGGLFEPAIGYRSKNIIGDTTYNNTTLPQHLSYLTYEFTTGQGASSLLVTASISGANNLIGLVKCTGNRTGCSDVPLNSLINGFGSTYPYVYVVVANGDTVSNNPTYSITVDIGDMPTTRYVTLANKKWNLVFLPLAPASTVPADVFSQQNLHLYLVPVVASSYIPLYDMNVSQTNLTLGSAVWAYPDFDTGAVSLTVHQETSDEFTFSLQPNKWTVIGTPSVSVPKPYDIDHIAVSKDGGAYNRLTYALSENWIEALYYYDSESETYKPVTPSVDSLEPWRAYLLKSNITGTILVTEE